MALDTACAKYNLIARNIVVDRLDMEDLINPKQETILECLNGTKLVSSGTIFLQWKGKGFREIFKTEFHIVDDTNWEVILGADTIRQHGILKFAGFGARAVIPRQTKRTCIRTVYCSITN